VLGFAVLVLAGSASATHDTDGDNVDEEVDNCPAVFNADQVDSDGDGRGNTCDDSKGIPADSSGFVVYFRDQNGRHTPCVTTRMTQYLGTEVQGRFEGCAIFLFGQLWDPDVSVDRIEVEQLAPPEGCTGGFAAPIVFRYSPQAWHVVDIRYRCGTSGTPIPPPATFRDTFAAVGQAKPHAVKITAATPVSVVTVKWTDRRNRFDLSAIQNVRRTLSARPSAEEQTPEKLKITRRRTATSLTVRIEKLKPGTLRFKVVSKVVQTRAVVVTRVSRRAR
jgi:hypothetical protein